MAKTQIYLVRHGQSVGNLNHLFLGHKDLDLSDLGRKQAERVCEYFQGISVDKIYASDLLRAYHTACPLAKEKGIEIIKNPRLREVYAGEWEGMPYSELFEKYPETAARWWEDTGLARPNGGESVAELQERVYSEVLRLAEENEGKTICLFTHFTPIFAMKTALAGVSLSEMKHQERPKNASVSHIEFENGKFSLISYGVNDYLRELASQCDV
jgi:probable phosphoglycerate mutase